MNIIAVIILGTIVADLVLNGLADYANLKRLRNDIPHAFEGLYDPLRYRQSQEYLRVNTRFGWVGAIFDVLLVLVFWFGKGFPILDRWVRSWQMGEIWTGLAFIGILLLLKSVVSLPFNIYHTFVIEERFGFNKMDWKTFAADRLKGMGLALVLGGPLLAGVLWFFSYAGPNAWWYCWTVVAIYMLGVQYVAPTWIMPLFNRFRPLEDNALKAAIMAYAISIKFPLDNVLEMDGSRRSSKSNAFFTGFGKHKRIVLFDTLIGRHTMPELIAILAHEMGHYKKKHVLQMLVIGLVQMGIFFYLLSLFMSYRGLYDAFYMDRASVHAGLIFFGMLVAPLDFFLGMFVQILSRKNELEADRFAVATTGDPGALAEALKKLSVHNLSNLFPHPVYVFLHYSHPPILSRLRAIGQA